MKNSIIKATILTLTTSLIFASSITYNVSAKTLDNSNKFFMYANQQHSSFLTAEEEKELRASFLEDGLNALTIEQLIQKKKNGQELDCEKASELKKVPTSFFSFNRSEKTQEKTYKFPDGSYIKIKIEGSNPININCRENNHNPGISTFSIENSHYASIYRNEKMQAKLGTTRLSFYASFWRMSNQANIEQVYNAEEWGYGNISLVTQPTIVNNHCDAIHTDPCLAYATWHQTTGIGFWTKTSSLTLNLKVTRTGYSLYITKG